jgi:hypothetical protein
MNRLFLAGTLLTAASLVAAGCFLGGRMDASDWDQNCKSDDDCAVVTQGNVCTDGNLAAINADEESEFRDERQRRRDKCLSTTSSIPGRAPRVGARCSSDGQCWVKTGVSPYTPPRDAGIRDAATHNDTR